MEQFTSEKINPGVTKIVCPRDVFAYLVEGQRKALLIDTGFGVGSLKTYVDSLTSLPYVVILTHGHIDHVSGVNEFDKVYINQKDLPLTHGYVEEGKVLLPLTDGQNFDLGGVTVTALELPGHTPGSMAILIREDRMLLLGDACNSFGYLQLPESSSVKEYRDNLITFRKNADLFDEVLYSHPHNFGGKEILEETIALCGEVLEESFEGIPMDMPHFGGCFSLAKEVDEASHRVDGGTANFIYRSKI